MLSADLDLSKPSFNGARYFAITRMREAGRMSPDDSDKAELARLLWHVEGDEGGFLRLGDEARAERAAALHLPIKIVEGASWATGDWPGARDTSVGDRGRSKGHEGETEGRFHSAQPAAEVARQRTHYLDPMALIRASALSDEQLADPARMACASTIERVAMEEVRRERDTQGGVQ